MSGRDTYVTGILPRTDLCRVEILICDWCIAQDRPVSDRDTYVTGVLPRTDLCQIEILM